MSDKSPPAFTATNEWQIVPPGTAIPKGLWVKADLENDVVMARLNPPPGSASDEGRENSCKAIEVAPSNPNTNADQAQSQPKPDEQLLPTSIAGILKWSTQFHDTRSGPSDFGPMDPERREWLKQVMDSMNTNVAKQIKVLVEALQTAKDERAEVDALEAITDLVEDLDNARDLHLVGGFAPVIAKLSSPHADVRAAVSAAIATVVQNNPETQGFADELNCWAVAFAFFLQLTWQDITTAVDRDK